MMSIPATIISFFIIAFFFFFFLIGHYLIPGYQTTEKSQTSEMLSNTLLPSINCTVGKNQPACIKVLSKGLA